MLLLRSAREQAGLSQRELARRADVAFRTIQLMEAGRHDARLSTFVKVAEALGRSPAAVRAALEGSLAPVGGSAAEAAEAVLRDGFDSWKLHLFDFVDAFRRSPSASLVESAPAMDSDPRIAALFASSVEALCAEQGVRVPWWCAGVRALPDPWFVAGVENLKASALVESPAVFRRRGVFVLENFLSRA